MRVQAILVVGLLLLLGDLEAQEPLTTPAAAPHSTPSAAAQSHAQNKQTKAAKWLHSESLAKTERVAVFARGSSCSERTSKILQELHVLKSPNSLYLRRAFPEPLRSENQEKEAVERLCDARGASLFGISSNTKKKPHNVLLGRLFDGQASHFYPTGATQLACQVQVLAGLVINATVHKQILDKFELMGDYNEVAQGSESTRPSVSATPCFIFLGRHWLSDKVLSEFKNFVVDGFGVRHTKSLAPGAVERAVVCTAMNSTHFSISHHSIQKQGKKMQLNPAIAHFTFQMRSSSLADVELMRDALGLNKKLTKEKIERRKGKKMMKKARRTDRLRTMKNAEMKAKGQIPDKQEMDDFLRKQRASSSRFFFSGNKKK